MHRGSTSKGTTSKRRSSDGYDRLPPQSDTDAAPLRSHGGRGSQHLEPNPPPIPFPSLSSQEFAFFEKVKQGDFEEVEKTLESDTFKKRMNINKINKEGYTALHLAVKTQDVPMVQLLLSVPGIELYDTILHAINERNVELTKILLAFDDKITAEEQKKAMESSIISSNDKVSKKPSLTAILSSIRPHHKKTGSAKSGSSNKGITVPIEEEDEDSTESAAAAVSGSFRRRQEYDERVKKEKEDSANDDIPFDSAFHPVITPLMLAAHVGDEELVELFYDRYERLENSDYEHNLPCKCDICVKLDGDKDMTRAYQRIHLFNAICQPVYICFLAKIEKKDPVNYAIDKILKLRNICASDSVLGEIFEKPLATLDDFLMKFLGCCRTTEETKTFMSVKDSENKERLPHQHPRLWYAVGLNLRNLVGHPYSQNLVREMWLTEYWAEWESYGFFFQLFNLLIRIIAFPVIALIIFLAQDTEIGKTLSAPISRFMTYLGSYVFFLSVIWFQVYFPFQRCNDQTPYYEVDDAQCQQRGPPNMGTEWVIIVYVLSFLVTILKRQSVSWYWTIKWNWVEMAGTFFFFLTFISWLSAWLWVNDPANEDLIYATERIMWPADCAEIFGECLLAVSVMLSFLRLLRFTQVFPEIGPMQVGVGKQIVAYICMGACFSVVLFAFSAGLMAIYVPYKDYRGLDPKGYLVTQDYSLTSPLNSLHQLFWNTYDQDSAEAVTLVKWKANFSDTTEEPVHHYYNEYAGNILFMGFKYFGVGMMFEVLTGYFGSTYEDLMVDASAVWRFTRTELYMTFIKDTMLPPPFTLIPTLKTLVNAGKWVTLLGRKEDPQAGCNFRQCCFITESPKIKEWKGYREKYRRLVLVLICRYKYNSDEAAGEEMASREDVLAIGEELAEIKEMLKKVDKGSKANLQNDSSDLFPPPPPPSRGNVLSKQTKYKLGGNIQDNNSAPVITSQPSPQTPLRSSSQPQTPQQSSQQSNTPPQPKTPRPQQLKTPPPRNPQQGILHQSRSPQLASPQQPLRSPQQPQAPPPINTPGVYGMATERTPEGIIFGNRVPPPVRNENTSINETTPGFDVRRNSKPPEDIYCERIRGTDANQNILPPTPPPAIGSRKPASPIFPTTSIDLLSDDLNPLGADNRLTDLDDWVNSS